MGFRCAKKEKELTIEKLERHDGKNKEKRKKTKAVRRIRGNGECIGPGLGSG